MLTAMREQLIDAGIDPAFFDMVAQIAHFSVWYGIVLTFGLVGKRFHHYWLGLIISFVCCTIYAIVHEFWWDPTHENEATRGSDMKDFGFLIFGGIAGGVVSYFI